MLSPGDGLWGGGRDQTEASAEGCCSPGPMKEMYPKKPDGMSASAALFYGEEEEGDRCDPLLDF